MVYYFQRTGFVLNLFDESKALMPRIFQFKMKLIKALHPISNSTLCPWLPPPLYDWKTECWRPTFCRWCSISIGDPLLTSNPIHSGRLEWPWVDMMGGVEGVVYNLQEHFYIAMELWNFTPTKKPLGGSWWPQYFIKRNTLFFQRKVWSNIGCKLIILGSYLRKGLRLTG